MTLTRLGAAAFAILVAGLAPAAALDRLKVAVGGQKGVGETFPVELGQAAGIFAKYGLDLDPLYTDSSGET